MRGQYLPAGHGDEFVHRHGHPDSSGSLRVQIGILDPEVVRKGLQKTVISPPSRYDVQTLGARLSKPESDKLEDQAAVMDR